MKRHRILIVDDEKDILDSLRLAFEEDYEVVTASSGEQGLEILQGLSVSVMIVDQRMPGMDGVTFLDQAMQLAPKAVRIILTGYTDMDALIAAVNSGQIYRYIHKPWEPDALKMDVRRAVERFEMSSELEERYGEILRLNQELEEAKQKLELENVQLRHAASQRYVADGLIGQSPAMERVYDLIEKVLNSDVTVILTGETGTGKELLARCVHFNGPRKEMPFVAQNCGALPPELLESELFGHRKGAFTGAVEDRPGMFEAADGGTIFLDEIGDTSMAMQVRLLRVLQEGEIRRVGEVRDRKINVRTIAATNQDLKVEVEAKRFREDLYFRLNVFPIEVPPLRDRTEDVPLLVAHFLKTYATEREVLFAAEAMDLLCRYSWPGNVRELENEVRRALLLAGEAKRIGPEVLTEVIRENASPGKLRFDGTLKAAIVEVERKMIVDALNRSDGNRTHAARMLGVSRWGLVQKIEKYGIEGAVKGAVKREK